MVALTALPLPRRLWGSPFPRFSSCSARRGSQSPASALGGALDSSDTANSGLFICEPSCFCLKEGHMGKQ